MRHFEVWAIARKVSIVTLSIFLDDAAPATQAWSMAAVVFVALLLQGRLRPYDDENEKNDFNAADAVLFNNDVSQSVS